MSSVVNYSAVVSSAKPSALAPVSLLRQLYNKLWNLGRRPFVWSWQRRVVAIAEEIKIKLIHELLPHLYDNMRAHCEMCAFHYQFLKSQPFTSQIELALTKNACIKHVEQYYDFWEKHEGLFTESHELADKICGFTSVNPAR